MQFTHSFGSADEESLELERAKADVLTDTDSFEAWDKLIKLTDSLEGGLNRNSIPHHIAATREVYDKLLAKFPLFFGYWKKYADLEFSIGGTEAAELVYERGTASISNSVDLWVGFCAFKSETCHEGDVTRELFERAASSVGLDFMAHPFWDKYIEWEERQENPSARIFQILERVIHIPMHQYARYFERFRQMAQSRPINELAPEDVIEQFRADIEREGIALNEAEREIRSRCDNLHMEIFNRTQTETTKRWTYESEIKRPYFHINELEEGQLVNWRKYLDFEEVEGSEQRTIFLYERALVAAALYDEFWLRYARWLSAKPGRDEDVRNIYLRACALYVPISRPKIRLQFAFFEEAHDRVEVAKDIHGAILDVIPGSIETIISLANLSRRHGGLEAAIAVYKAHINGEATDIYAKAVLVSEWAKLLWRIKGSVTEARQVFEVNAQWYQDSRYFWINWLEFEMQQPTSAETEKEQYELIKKVHSEMRSKGRLPIHVMKDISSLYMVYLSERGSAEAAKEYMAIDREVNGPFSVQTELKTKLAEDGNLSTTEKRMALENGHPGVSVNEVEVRKGVNPYTQYYKQQGDIA